MSDQQARAALATLSGPLAVPDTAALERQHQQVRPRLRQFVRDLPARRRRKAWQRQAATVGGIALCAAVLVLGVASFRTDVATPEPYRVEQGRSAAPRDERHGFSTGPSEPAALRTRRGAHVLVAPGTRIRAVSSDESHEQVELARGSLRVHVPKLGPSGAFSIQTPDSKVTVHGTVFSVTVVGEPAAASTCVQVIEGLVSVERAGKVTMVKGGEQLNCSPLVASAAMSSPQPARTAGEVAAPAPAPAASVRESRTASASSSTASRAADVDLAAQNALLSGALRAERAGQYAEARSQLERLLAHYPQSALRPDAERSLERVKRKLP